ncbi:MAG: hypothetical protein ABSF34_13855, partial [Verrucomicrobiota bacterium]
IRERQRKQQQLADSANDRSTECAEADLFTTTTVTTYPTVAGAFYACHPTQVNGNEVEGGVYLGLGPAELDCHAPPSG